MASSSEITVAVSLDSKGAEAGLKNVASAAKEAGNASTLSMGGAAKAIGGVNAAAQLATGGLSSMSAGVAGVTNAMRAFGVSLEAVQKASVVLAAVSATFKLVQTIISVTAEKAMELADIRFDNMVNGANRYAEALRESAAAMERLKAVSEAARDSNDENRRLEHEEKIAQIENRRAKELAQNVGNKDAQGAINRRYDAEIRAENLSYTTGANDRDEKRTRADLEKKRREIQEARNQVEYYNAQSQNSHADARDWAEKATGFFITGKRDEYMSKSQRSEAKAQEFDAARDEAAKRVRDLEAEAEMLEMKLGKAARRNSIEIMRDQTEAIKAQTEAAAEAMAKNEAAKTGPAEEEAPAAKAPGLSSIGVSTDRLARIGGFVGGAGSAASIQQKSLSVAEAQKKILEDFYRNWQTRPNAAVLA